MTDSDKLAAFIETAANQAKACRSKALDHDSKYWLAGFYTGNATALEWVATELRNLDITKDLL
jgi:hypothetical protein